MGLDCRIRAGQADPLGVVVVDLPDGQPPAGEVRAVAGGGDASQEVGDEAGHRLVRPLRRVEADAPQHVDPQPAVDVPGGASVLGRGDGELGQVEAVVLVAHLADEFLDDVLQGDHARSAAVLVDDDGDGLLAAQSRQQRPHRQGLGDQDRRLGDPADGGAQPVVHGHGERVLEVHHADDLVDLLPVDGEAGQSGGAGQVDHVLGGRGGLQGTDLHARGHHVLGGEVAQRQRAHEQVGRVLLQRAGLRGVAGQRDQLAGGAGGGQFLGRFHAQGPDEPVGDGVERRDHRAEQAGEDVLRARDEAGDLQRPGHRPVLRDELADHHLYRGGQQHADHDREGGEHSLGQAEGGQRAAQQFGQRRFGEHADDEGGDGDAELGAGELERELLERLDDRACAPVALGGGLLGLGPLHGDQTEFGGHEEAVGKDQYEGRCEEQQGDGHDAAARARARNGSALCRQGAAQVLQDGPSIAGGSHSSDSRSPRAPGGAAGAEALCQRLRPQD
ncbi:hypothetical protein B0E37_00773 [Streptomyces sp. MH192]|nr:hypothetical protein [Streptomyces sp. MH192]MCF0102757.1 hypothetical protein [Streptomyces sp. MH191]